MTKRRHSPEKKRWFRIFRPAPDAATRLLCLPHAGGAASFFRSWAADIPPAVEVVAVQYPGREERIDEPLIDAMEPLVDALADAVPEVADRPYVLFGHSMGAAVAHELCLALRRRGTRLPSHLVVSGREAPSRYRRDDLHRGDDSRLCEELQRLDATAPELLHSPEWRTLALPIIRNDYRLIETYRPADRAPLPVPIMALAGRQDGELLPGDAEAWAEETAARFSLRRFPGGHFYLAEQRREVVHALLGALDTSDVPERPSSPPPALSAFP